MQMQKFAVLAALVLAFTTLSFGQLANPQSHRVLGFFDPATGAFEPLSAGLQADAPPVAATTGSLVFKFTINAKSGIPKNGVIDCTVNVYVTDASGFNASERGAGVATLSSGTTYTCTATIDYSWLLTSPTTDKITVQDVSAGVLYGYQATATNGTAIVVEPVAGRTSSQSNIAPFTVPANGATTTETVSITL
jgi:hypothetical protein